MAVTQTGHNKLKNLLLSLVKEGRYTIENTAYITPIYRTSLNGDVIQIYLYLDHTVNGTITKFELIDVDGEVFDDQPDSITKPTENGLLILFKYTLKRV